MRVESDDLPTPQVFDENKASFHDLDAIAKHLALLSEAGLVTAEPGERRRVRYRLRSAPMQVAQQYMAAFARDWDGSLAALQDHLDRTTTTQPEEQQ